MQVIWNSCIEAFQEINCHTSDRTDKYNLNGSSVKYFYVTATSIPYSPHQVDIQRDRSYST